MADRAGQSNFATDGSLDTADTLTAGASPTLSTTLLADLPDSAVGEGSVAQLTDATGAPIYSAMTVDDEFIIYTSRRRNYDDDPAGVDEVYDLIRTAPVDHMAGAPVVIFNPPLIDNPGLIAAVIELQVKHLDHETRIAALE